MKQNASVIDALAWLWDVLQDFFWLIGAVGLALAARGREKPVDVGLGPEPMINNVYHKRALIRAGFTAETFIETTSGITCEFDHILPQGATISGYFLSKLRLFWHVISRYKILYIYFNGGPFIQSEFLWRLEPHLLHLAGLKVVVMAYGGDVYDLSRDPNLLHKHAMAVDYPSHGRCRRRVIAQIDLWTRHADHVLAGCDWVDYLYHWDTLQIAHFSMDTEAMAARAAADPPRPTAPGTRMRVLHAPNHRTGKGTSFFLRAVEELAAEGVPIEIELLEHVSNERILTAILNADVILDQLVVGWYAMFAIEAMALGRPVVCYIRPDLRALYVNAGLLEPDELPIIDAMPQTVKEVLRSLATRDRRELAALGQASQAYVQRHHSLEAIGADFSRINRRLGVVPAKAG